MQPIPSSLRRVGVEVVTRRSWDIAEALNSQQFDLGLGSYSLSVPEANEITFAEPDEVCVVPLGHPLQKLSVITPQDLKANKFVYLARSDHPYRYRLDSLFNLADVHRRYTIETSNSATACAMVAEGAGVAIVNPFTALDFLHRGLVMRRFSASLPFTTTLWRAKHRPNSPLVDMFIGDLFAVRDEQLLTAQTLLDRNPFG